MDADVIATGNLRTMADYSSIWANRGFSNINFGQQKFKKLTRDLMFGFLLWNYKSYLGTKPKQGSKEKKRIFEDQSGCLDEAGAGAGLDHALATGNSILESS